MWNKGLPRCDFITSHHDAQGGTDLKVGSNVATVEKCIELVNSKRVNEPLLGVNGMTYVSEGSKDCYAEIKATRIGPYGCSKKCQTCIFKGET